MYSQRPPTYNQSYIQQYTGVLDKKLSEIKNRNIEQEKQSLAHYLNSCRFDEFHFFCATEPPDSKLSLLQFKM